MKSRAIFIPAFCCLYFILIGFLLIPYAGFQHDEVLFAQPIFQRGLTFYSYKIGYRLIPMMVNSYLGTLKTWIFWPIFKVWHPSVYSLRVPALLAGAASIVLFWKIMRRAGGERAAIVATVLLATDSMYLLTSVFDWGPVVLQHLLALAAILLAIEYHETGSPKLLALSFFLAGLALWDKALFFWVAAGLAVAGAVLYPNEIWRRFSLANASIAIAAFSVGAAPFILYNLHKPNSTLGENATFSTEGIDDKIEVAKRTVNSHALFGYIVFDDWVQPPRAPRTALEAASLSLRDSTGVSQKNAMLWAYGLGLLLAPFAWKTRAWRPMLFALVFSVTGWGLMLLTKGAGASVHHVILLWPMPLMFLALAFSEASRRPPAKVAIPALGLVVGFFAAGNVLATNQYLAQFVRNGPTAVWTNAIYPLSSALMQNHYGEVDGIDWDTIEPLRVLERATVPLDSITVEQNHPEQALSKMGRSGIVFLGHVKEREMFPGVDEHLDAIAASHGLSKRLIQTFPDENGRPIFELFQYGGAGNQ